MSALPQPSQQFISDNAQLHQTTPKRRGGSRSKLEKEKCIREIFKLHIIYGYSATHISEMMQINKRTVLGDIDRIYHRLQSEYPENGLVDALNKYQVRLEHQRTGLVEMLDKEKDPDRQLSIRRLILEIDTRLNEINDNILKRWAREDSYAAQKVNKFAKANNIKGRYIAPLEIMTLPGHTYDKIMRIVREG